MQWRLRYALVNLKQTEHFFYFQRAIFKNIFAKKQCLQRYDSVVIGYASMFDWCQNCQYYTTCRAAERRIGYAGLRALSYVTHL